MASTTGAFSSTGADASTGAFTSGLASLASTVGCFTGLAAGVSPSTFFGLKTFLFLDILIMCFRIVNN